MSCTKCCRVISRKTISVTAGASVNLTITNVPSPINNDEKFRICIAQCIPTLVTPVVVQIVVNGVAKPLVDSFGNAVYSDQIRSRRVYCMTFATTLNSFVVNRCELCCTTHVFPQTVIPVVVMAPVTLPPVAPEEV